jgi:hypothetical protein
MPKTYVKAGGVQREAKQIYVKTAGVWQPSRRVYAKVAGAWQQVFGTNYTTQAFTTSGTFTVPTGIYSLTVTLIGGGGGGGAGFGGGGGGGAGGQGGGSGGYYQAQSISVVPGQVIPVTVGTGGAGRGVNAGAGFAGTSSSVGSYTATGGNGGSGWLEAIHNTDTSGNGAGGTPSGAAGVGGTGIAFGGTGHGGNGGSTPLGVGGTWSTVPTGYGGGGAGGDQVNYGNLGGLNGGNGGNGSGGYVSIAYGISSQTFSTVGTYSFTVPAGVNSVRATYATITGLVTTPVAVTPGQVITGTIGDFGASSTFGSITAPVYTKTVGQLSATIDYQLYVTYNLLGGTYSVDVETSHGALAKSIQAYSVPTSSITGNVRTLITAQSHAGTYTPTINTQPTPANGYTSQVLAIDTNNGEGGVSYTLTVQQQVPFSITW